MKRIAAFLLSCLLVSVGCSQPEEPVNLRYPYTNWVKPLSVEGDLLTLEGFVQVDRSRLIESGAKEFNGNYFLGSQRSGGQVTPLFSDWYDRLSKLVGKKVRITAKVRRMKSGSVLQIKTLETLK